MKTLAKYHVCNSCVIGEKTFKNILIGPDKLPGLSRKGPMNLAGHLHHREIREVMSTVPLNMRQCSASSKILQTSLQEKTSVAVHNKKK